MSTPTDNETWIIDIGAEILEKKASASFAQLALWERLIYCLWVADYGMRNAGDLDSAEDLFASFQSEGEKISQDLGLEQTRTLFSLGRERFQSEYMMRFDPVCDELRNAR